MNNGFIQCLCATKLCQHCLKKELKLTEGRLNGNMNCTVCKTLYIIKLVNLNKYQQFISCIKFIFYETLLLSKYSYQNKKQPSIKDKKITFIGLLSLSIWYIISTYII